jgi:hypothetical protein
MHITETWHGKPCGTKVLGTKRTRAPIPIPFAYQVFKIISFKIFVFALLYIYFLHGSAYVLALFCILIPTSLG